MEIEDAKQPVQWALALGGDAQLPAGELPVSGKVPEHYMGAKPYFVTGIPSRAASRDLSRSAEEVGGIVIFGSRDDSSTSFSLNINMRGSLLEDVGEYITLSTPMLGHIIPGNREEPRPDPYPTDFMFEKGDPKLLAMLMKHRWYEPERLEVLFDAEDYEQLVGARQEVGTLPVTQFGQEWQANGTLQVQASFRRPDKAAENERLLFFAGVLVSLAASFFVWALELFLGPGRDPVAARSSRPRRPD